LHIIRFQSLDFPDFHLFVQETMKRNKLCKHIHLVVQSFHV
jgi:tRNA A37 methylthiotransferase MiaB